MGRAILVVDDDPAMVRTLCDVFRLRGWHADGAQSGEEALERAHSGSYPIVLMDVKMPGIDGIQACRELSRAQPSVRTILMSAHASNDVASDARAAGAERLLSKPVDLRELLSMLG